MLSPMLLAQVQAELRRWEQVLQWMYLDSEGRVTVGCGTMLPDADSAAAIPFFHEKSGVTALPAEVEAAWNQLHLGSAAQKAAAPKKKFNAAHYFSQTDLRITNSTAFALRDKHILSDYDSLLSIYPKFDSFPDNAKLALFDMIYNLGPGAKGDQRHRASGLRRYGVMNDEINRGQWVEAASHSSRHGIPAERNQMVRNLLRSCAPLGSMDPAILQSHASAP